MSFSAPKVYTMPGFKSNVKHLQGLTRVMKSASFKTKAQEIVSLYTDKKIRNIRTVENATYIYIYNKPTTLPKIWSGRG